MVNNQQSREISSPYIDSRKYSANSLHYSAVRVGDEKSAVSLNQSALPKTCQPSIQQSQQYHNALTESRMNVKSVIAQKQAPTNYLEMLEKIKKQNNDEKSSYFYVKVNQGGEGKQTIIEKCLTNPDQSPVSTNFENKRSLYESNIHMKANIDMQPTGILKDSFKANQSPHISDKNSELSMKNNPNFFFTPVLKDKDTQLNGKVKQIRLSPHKHSHTQFNLSHIDSPSALRKRDIFLNENKLSTPTFKQRRGYNSKDYPKVYDELYAYSFKYPEQDDHVLEEEQNQDEEESPFQVQQNNFISFTPNTILKQQNEDYTNSSKLDLSRTNFYGDHMFQNNQQSDIKSSQMLVVPLSKQNSMTHQPHQLIKNLLQENKNLIDFSITPYKPLLIPYEKKQSSSSNDLLGLSRITIPSPNLFTESLNNNYQKSQKESLNSYQLSGDYQTQYQNYNLQTNYQNSKNVDVKDYFKENNIPEYKPYFNSSKSQNSLNLYTPTSIDSLSSSIPKYHLPQSITINSKFEQAKQKNFNTLQDMDIKNNLSYGLDRKDISTKFYSFIEV